MSRIEGRSILLGVSGGIACYKAAELLRRLTASGARVRVIMTANAQEFITPLTLQTLSGSPVATRTFDLTQESEIGHIRLADQADVVMVAPATANLIGKHAAGIADDLLTTVLLATRAPLLLAPAMNVHMWEHPAVQENLERLRRRGARVVPPESGSLACGYEGAGRLAAVEHLVAEVERALTPQDLDGERILVSAGPTREAIDPVRFISNRSSGKMGYALAAAAWRRGAEVILVSGPCARAVPYGIRVFSVQSAAEMRDTVLAESAAATVTCMAAAVADYRVRRVADRKIKKQGGTPPRIELEETEDILAELGRRKSDGRIVIGFAAETHEVVEHARGKRTRKNADMIVANDVSATDAGFDVDTNRVTIVDGDGEEELPLADKNEIADRIWDRIVELRRRHPRNDST